MHADIVWTALLAGAATFLIRLLPSLVSDRLAPDRLGRRARALVLALGPAAIAALLALSVAPLAQTHGLATAAGIAATIAIHRLSASAILATLAGATAYGLIIAFPPF